MATRVTFPICLAYAWCVVEEDGVEEHKLIAVSGETAVDAANALVENYNLDPATQVLVVVLNLDAPDPIAMSAEVHVPDRDATVTVSASKPE